MDNKRTGVLMGLLRYLMENFLVQVGDAIPKLGE
jgi:hypothetical protein